ncbi:transcription factor mef2A, partial [Aplysia californica]|uniref:Transcription factor mef2A n=1 Tax=Aplysia californica TaxID=6500 RepID=A0ABM0K2S5_APLCA
MADPYTYRRTSLSVHGLQEALDSHDRITKGNYDSGNNTTSHSNNYFNNHNINNNSSSNNNNTHHSYRDDDNDDRNRREYNNGYNDTSKGRGGDNNNDYSNAAARDHNGDNRLARRDDEREKDDDGNERKSDSRGNKTHRGKPKGESVRKRYYDTSEMEDVLQDKIATQLRENGIAETKVVTLSAKISQAVRDDVIDSENGRQPQVTANLTEAINKHLDPMLYNRDDATDLRDSQKPRDAIHLSNLVLLRLGQIHEEVDQAKRSSEDLQKTARKNKEAGGRTPRDEQSDRSQIMAIKENIEKGKTER